MKSLDFYKKREEKRTALKQELPIDKQLEGSFGKAKWKFKESLYKIRNSENPSDKYFIEKLKQYNGLEIDSSLELIKEAKEEEEDLIKNLNGIQSILKGLGDKYSYVRSGTAESLGALASVNPELFISLYEKGLGDEDVYVRSGTAESLGALASVNPRLASQLYEKGLGDEDVYVRSGTAESLGALASVNPRLASQLYEKGLGDEDWSVRSGTAKSLGALASVNPELFISLYEKGLGDENVNVRSGTAESLGALASVNPRLASQLYEKGLGDEDWSVRSGTAKSLGALASVNPELFISLYEKGLGDEDVYVRSGTAESLGALASVNPRLASQLYEKGLGDEDWSVRSGTAKSLGALASVNPRLASQLYEKGLGDEDWSVRSGTAKSLGALASVNPRLASQLYEKGLGDENVNVRSGTAKSLGALASVNPRLASQLYEKGLGDEDWSVRSGTAKSLGALASVNPRLASQLYEKGLGDEDVYVRSGTAESLGALASVNPRLASQLYEKGLGDENVNVRSGTAKSLKNYPFIDNPLSNKIDKIIKEKTDDSNYLFSTSLLVSKIKENNPSEIWEYLNIFNKTKDYLEDKNKGLDETKKIASVEKFFSDNQLILSDLAKIFKPKDFGVFLTNLSSETLLYTKSFLDISKPALNNPYVVESLKNYFSKNSLKQDKVEKMFEFGVQFIKSKKADQFVTIVDQGENVQELLEKELLDIIVGGVGIDTSKLPAGSLDRWNKNYLVYLGSNNKIIEKRIEAGESNYENVLDLYKKIVERGFVGDFKDFILDKDNEDEIGQNLANHNDNVFSKLKDLGVDPKAWYEYGGVQDFLVSKEVKVDNTKHFQEVLRNRAEDFVGLLSQIKDELIPRQYEPLMHILHGAKNKGLSDIKNYEELKKQYQLLKNRIINIKEGFSNQKEEYFGTLFEHLGHLEEAVELFKEENISSLETKEQGFRVKLWDRDPARDLFQGNYTHCCIAVGVKDAPQEGGLYTHDPATVAQFLADAGVQVAEVYDQEKKDPIANTWLFVSKDSNGEPVLVLDNVEVNNRYKDIVVNTSIRDNLFTFVKDYAKKCNIPKVGIGMVGTNDIEWGSLNKMIVAPVDKVGGYLKDYTSKGGSRPGRYYLEAYNAQALGEIYNEDRVLDKEIKENINSGLITAIDLTTGISSSFSNDQENIQSFANRNNLSYESIIEDLNNIEAESFSNSGLEESPEEILENIQSEKGISFVFMEGGRITGYLTSQKANEAELPQTHNEFDARGDNLYVESIAGKIDPFQALNKLKEQAKERGYKKILLHGINPRLNRALVRCGFEPKATIENWGNGKAEYMELRLD